MALGLGNRSDPCVMQPGTMISSAVKARPADGISALPGSTAYTVW